MKVDEFRIKLKSVSDGRLAYMHASAQTAGPAAALPWIEEEIRRRESVILHQTPQVKVAASTTSLRIKAASHYDLPADELSSQIRPLAEVLGEPFSFSPYRSNFDRTSEMEAKTSNDTLENSSRSDLIAKLEAALPPNLSEMTSTHSEKEGAYSLTSETAVAELDLRNESVSAVDQTQAIQKPSRGYLMAKAFLFVACLLGAVLLLRMALQAH